MTQLYYPLRSLREGHWFKLICGASFQHLPAVRTLTLAYTLAGADCIDVAADPAVIGAAQEGLKVAADLEGAARSRGFSSSRRPWLMVSLNDAEDPHFRKAEFDPDLCPADCPRPCEKICPAQAIEFHKTSEKQQGQPWKQEGQGKNLSIPYSPSTDAFSGVIDQRCYGCGRCLPVCPSQLIYTRSYVSAPTAVAELVMSAGVDALEIHTRVGHWTDFQRLWQAIAPWADQLKLLAISCPDGEGLLEYLWAIYNLIAPLPCTLIWQTDGRPMSGDIGIGATRAAVKLAQKVLAEELPGYVQLAGGTNQYTVSKLRTIGLLKNQIENRAWRVGTSANSEMLDQKGTAKIPASSIPSSLPYVSGIAYGSYARTLLSPILDQLEKLNEENIHANLASTSSSSLGHLEEFPDLLWQAVASAHSLVSQLKSAPVNPKFPQPLFN
ncbi:MAG TPA: 4Fe-4S ferredoxin [Cyanobacteria bacterium UBA8803]|nr:4Fe-4S ferredoxin [Cyanobacteria bacterium UBA9273]HBL60073.1 4Fe-4S ferredoxin [Cyanobacteria bacterium UBA8803]